MQYEIWGGQLPAVTIKLQQGESIYTQSGGLAWMSDGIDMQTNMKGGLGKALGRMFSGESPFMATYTARSAGANITFASTMPGEIRTFSVQPGLEYIVQKSAFLCAEPGVSFSATVGRGGVKGALFGGEGLIMQRYSGQGMFFLELDGAVCEYDLAPGETIKVDTGNVAAFEASVNYSAEMVKGFANILFGGEGLFLTTLTGPGKVWLQTMSTAEMAARIIPFLPKSN